MSGVNCPECYMKDGDHKLDCSVGRMNDIPLITVSKLQENEDGSCDLEVTTNPEATRRLVDIGLNALLEKALDKDNDEYTIA